MDIYNNGYKTTYEFRNGSSQEIFSNFDEGVFYPDVLLIEFEDLNVKGSDSDFIIYKSINNVEVIFVNTTSPYDFYLILRKDISELEINVSVNLLENLSRNKIATNSENSVLKGIEYHFGFNKLELKSGKVKFSKSNINYLEYLCKRFEDVFETVINESR